MRRITTWVLSTVSALVLLFSYHTSTNAAATTSALASGAGGPNGASGDASSDPGTAEPEPSASSGASSSASPSAGSSTSASPSTGSSSSSSGSSSTGSTKAATVTGDAVQTRYGPVQVEITVKGGEITKSVVTQVPWSDGRDREINSYAVPILNDEAVQAQSAGIDMVSGATYTSEGYIRSLQSAIDAANL